jgi:hypothetical protein
MAALAGLLQKLYLMDDSVRVYNQVRLDQNKVATAPTLRGSKRVDQW